MSPRFVYALKLVLPVLLVGCGSASASTVDSSNADGGSTGDSTGKRTESTTTTTSETCELQIKQEQPAVVYDLDSVKLEFAAAAEGAACSIEIDGVKRDVACGGVLALRGTDFGVGFHTARLRSDLGNGRTSECAKAFRIAEPSACHYTFVTPTQRTEVDNVFDEKGRRIREVRKLVTGGTGETFVDYAYQGDSRRIASEVVTYKNVTGVDNSRRDINTRTYILGPTNALGLNEDLVKNIAFDDLADGKIDRRQTFFYDVESRVSVIEARNGDDPVLIARYAYQYDARGLSKTRTEDTNADGKDDLFVTYIRDKWGVLQSFKSTWQGGTSWSFQYLCGT